MQSGADCQFVLDAPCDRIARQASVRWDENAASRFTNHQHSPGLVGRRRLLLCFCSGQEASRSRSRDHVAAWATKQKRTQLAMSSSWRLDSRDRRSGADRRGRLPSRQSPPCQLAPDDRRWRLLDGCRQLTREPPVLAPRSCRGLAPRGVLSARSRKDADGSEMRVAAERRPPRPRCIHGRRVGVTARHAAGRHGPLTLLPLLRDVNGPKTLSQAASPGRGAIPRRGPRASRGGRRQPSSRLRPPPSA
jgi:hypothetical protein